MGITAIEVDASFTRKELNKPRYQNISIQEPIKESLAHLEGESPTQSLREDLNQKRCESPNVTTKVQIKLEKI